VKQSQFIAFVPLFFKNLKMKKITFFLFLLCVTNFFAQETYFTKTITDYDEVLNSNKN